MLSLLKNQWITAAVAQWMMSVGPSTVTGRILVLEIQTLPRDYQEVRWSRVKTRAAAVLLLDLLLYPDNCHLHLFSWTHHDVSAGSHILGLHRCTWTHRIKMLFVRKADFWASFPTRQITDGRNTAKTLGGVEDSWLLLFHHQQVSLDGLAQKFSGSSRWTVIPFGETLYVLIERHSQVKPLISPIFSLWLNNSKTNDVLVTQNEKPNRLDQEM